ncbi:FtsH protease activity modulator HflK [Azospirillum sp. RWY-5-1]|uniref:Protein HflK n=1 Tax=Azospirillum oleiclasticum TaxID=2735135 RepID=A0ABX2TD31_9PROT|nr:FtsH protease activity modulator HflK [Azospirillum oleiclasticum]NYZ17708.1 FtsH protease activity modulator HflK [Azospirillum oleiclasticum]NYZ21186.1 FtsH protease activity modulator HflK [Azospirillum oleiclasticum]
MPWTNQGGGGGGGPWGPPPGGGGPNPWGRPSGGGGGGPQPPDLEELLRRSQDRLKRVMPGGFGSGRGVAIVVGVLAAIWLASGIYRVEPDEQGVVMRFGEWVRTEQPGLRYHLPNPIETVLSPKVTRVNRIEVGYRSAGDGRRGDRDVPDESLMLTGDENIIDVDFSVFWVIKDAGEFLFKIRDPEATVKKAAESAMREVIGRTDLQPALTEARQQIEQQTLQLLQAMLDEYQAGIEVTQVQLQKADPPSPVIDAFNDVQRARADRERLRNEAEAYRNDIIPRARGEAERLVQEASAYREQVISLAQGDADRFRKVYEAYSLSKDVLAQRMYLETMEEVLQGTNKVIIDGNAQGAQGVVPYLPLNQLQPPAGSPPKPGQQRAP